jgi:hypothetical protein
MRAFSQGEASSASRPSHCLERCRIRRLEALFVQLHRQRGPLRIPHMGSHTRGLIPPTSSGAARIVAAYCSVNDIFD